MGLFKRLARYLGFGPAAPAPVGIKTPRGRVVDSRTSIPEDAKIEIIKAWSPVNDQHPGRFKTKPWGGWKDSDLVDEDQVVVHVISLSGGVDYYRTIIGPFADDTIESIIDLINAEFWNSSP